MFAKSRCWRINVPATQLGRLGFDGADSFRDRLDAPTGMLELEPSAGDRIESLGIKRGDRFILTGVSRLGGNDRAAVQHTVIAKGLVDDFKYSPVTKNAKVNFKNLKKLESDAHRRVIPSPKANGNVYQIDDEDWSSY